MYITIICIAIFIGFAIGFLIGYYEKVKRMEGDICIVHDRVEDQHYAFLRLKGSLDDIAKNKYASFQVVVQEHRE